MRRGRRSAPLRALAFMIWLAGTVAVAAEAPAPDMGQRIAVAGARLLAAYPEQLAAVEGNVLVWRDGTRMAIDDGKGDKPPALRLATADLKDQFSDTYPLGRLGFPPTPLADPGRYRHQAFFDKLYGDCTRPDFAANLVDVVWLPSQWGRTVKVTRRAGVAEKLARVSAELDRLPPQFLTYLRPPAGVLACRMIAGTTQRSMHAYAAAIDIALAHAHYWRWDKPDAQGRPVWRNAIPHEIVDVFERHGFIWGGKWHHYDTMHFEYRPELLAR